MFGLTPLGTIHTAISLVAVVAGLMAFWRDKAIDPNNRLGMVYLISTVLTCLTGFGIFQHGGFGKAHMLGIVTLLTLLVAGGAGWRGWFGRAAPYVATVGYSLSFFFHWIPAVTETSTRLPLGAPWLPNAEARELQTISGLLFLLFLIGAGWQVARLRRTRRRAAFA
jgi:uncharacterized membrane protein